MENIGTHNTRFYTVLYDSAKLWVDWRLESAPVVCFQWVAACPIPAFAIRITIFSAKQYDFSAWAKASTLGADLPDIMRRDVKGAVPIEGAGIHNTKINDVVIHVPTSIGSHFRLRNTSQVQGDSASGF